MSTVFSTNEDIRMVYLGAIFLALSVPIPLLFWILMKTIYTKDCQSSNLTFKLLNFVLFFQLLQGLGHLLTSPMLIFPEILKKFEVVITIIGCMMNTSWIGEIPMLSILSVCRALIFSNQMQSQTFPRLVKFFVFGLLSWTTFVFTVGCLTQNIIYLSPGWEYDPAVPYSSLFGILEIALSFPCLAISYTSYVFITVLIFNKKSQKSWVSSRRSELRLLFQSTFITTYLTIMIVVWHQNLFPFLAFIDISNKKIQAVMNGLWIMHCYINPAMVFIFNKPLREGCKKQFKAMFSCVSGPPLAKSSNQQVP